MCFPVNFVMIFVIHELFHCSISKVIFDSFYLIYILTSTKDLMVLSLKAYRQISKKWCFDKYNKKQSPKGVL